MSQSDASPGGSGPHIVERSRARGWLVSASVGAMAALLYGRTLCPTVSWYDSAEFSATAASLRVVPHPPGYPLYAIIGHAFTWLPGEAAWGMNVMSAVFGVLAVVLMHRVSLAVGLGALAAAVPAVLLALAPSVWANAVVAEVYTPGLAFLLSAILACLRARRDADPRWAWAGAGLAGLGLGVHMSLATWGLGFVALVGVAAWPALRSGLRPAALRWGLGCVVATGLGAAVFLLIPFGPFETVTPLGPYEDSFARLWARFGADIRGGVFRRYFKPMPIGPRLGQIASIVHANLGTGGVVAAAAGLSWSLLRARALAVACLLGALGNVVFFFRYDVPDLDVFLLPSVVSMALFAGWGVEAAVRLRGALGWAVAAVLAVSTAFGATSTLQRVDRSDDHRARAYGEAVCARVPEGAVMAMTSRPDEWHLYSVVLYMHEAQEGCAGIEFWGMASPEMIRVALEEGRSVYAFVPSPRFGWAFVLRKDGPVYRVTNS